jgi:outer membrane lipoprotein SlyB
MKNRTLSVLATTLVATLAGCASTDPMTGSTRNEIISVQYGRVENIQKVDMSPDYAAGSVIGGALGLLATMGHSGASQVGGAAVGAGLGAIVAKETAGSGEKFTVRLVNNNTIDIVTENQDIRLGDCVSLEQGKHANIRRVSPVMCTTPQTHPAYNAMNAANVQESKECHAVKQELLNATTEQATAVAYKKMRAFCES